MTAKIIAVIGGGAGGFAAAICAARKGCQVTIFEAQERVANSIKVTGDGRCNIANAKTKAGLYHNPEFVGAAFEEASPSAAIVFLESCGIMLRQESEGRLYPQANKSTSVIDALRLIAGRLGVRESCNSLVVSVSSDGDCWLVSLDNGYAKAFDKVILACGGGPAPLALLPSGVRTCDCQPLLAPIATNTQPLRGLDKVRAKCALSVSGHREEGEATFRSYGISGIAAFNLTRFAHPGDRILVDFLPQMEREESLPLLERRLESLQPQTWLDLTCGMLLPLVARAVLREAGIDSESQPSIGKLAQFDRALREFALEYKGIGDKKLRQVCRGGICVDQVDPRTMELRDYKGLHAVGEMLDVDGPCGGYNLHWAWVSGMIAGRAVSCD